MFLVDVNAERLAMAADLVAPGRRHRHGEAPVETVLKLTGGRGADVVITAAASGAAQEQALQMAARQGRISFFGGLPKDDPIITLDSNLVHYRELTIVGANGSSPAHNAEALRLIAEGAVPVADLITHRLPLSQVLDGIDSSAGARPSRSRSNPEEVPMPARTVAVASASGLHARPAKLFVQEAARLGVPVRIRVGDGKAVPANSMLGVLSLGAVHGTEVTLEADAPDAEEALDALAGALATWTRTRDPAMAAPS